LGVDIRTPEIARITYVNAESYYRYYRRMTIVERIHAAAAWSKAAEADEDLQ
jgi:hypothetical protein